MNKLSVAVALATVVSLGLSAPSWAADPSPSSTDSQGMQSPASPTAAAVDANDYTAKEVATANGQSIGTIDKLVIKDSDHQVYAVVTADPSLGLGDANSLAIPISQLQSQDGKWVVSSDTTPEQMKSDMVYDQGEFSAFETPAQPPMTK